MKKKFRFFMAAFAAVGLMASCSSEEVTPVNTDGTDEEQTETQGQGTYANFSLELNGLKSRATGYTPPTSGETTDNNPNDAKLDYGDVRLLIFNSVTKALEINEEFTTSQKTVLVQAGKKKIFVFGNTSGALNSQFAAIAALTTADNIDDFYAIVYDAGTPQALGTTLPTPRTYDIEPLHTIVQAGTKGLPVSSTNAIEYDLAPNIEETVSSGGTPVSTPTSPTNTFEIEAMYMLAKARLSLGNTEDDLTDFATTGNKVSDIKYTIRNLARYTNFTQNVVANVPQSYYYNDYDATTPAATFALDFDKASAMQSTTLTTTAGNYLYVPENNNKIIRRGQSSHFVINATFKPGNVITDADYTTSGTRFTYATLDASGSQNYVYTLTEIQSIPAGTYFKDINVLRKAAWLNDKGIPWSNPPAADLDAYVTTADEASVGGGDKYYQFTNAQSWYRLDLGESTTGSNLNPGVLRGKAYNAKINSITGPGEPLENLIEDPTREPDPVVSMTYISATITVKDWEVVGQVGDLH